MISITARLVTLATLLIPLVSATFTFNTSIYDSSTNSTDDYSLGPSWGISGPCVTAYTANIPCDKSLITYNDLALTNRKDICTNQCIDGLRKWRDNIRVKCTPEDVKAATSQLSDIGLTVIDSTGPPGAQVLASVASSNLPVVEALYFIYCMKDLKTGEICASTEDLTQNFDLKDNSTYCANSCLTQYAVFTYNVGVELYGSGENASGESAGVDIQTTCPGIDTSKYPVILSQQPASSFLFDSSSSSSSSSSNSSSGNSTDTSGPAANGTDTSKPDSAASSLKGSLWGMGSIVVAVAIGASIL